MNKIWLAPLAALYGAALTVRHKMYDWGWVRSTEFDIPTICVGNLTVGGTGKTPVTEFLVGKLSEKYKTAVLSRGYKRKTKGFKIVETKSSYRAVGDEPKQIKTKFPEVTVAVCEKRVEGVEKLLETDSGLRLIILDDAFQHRKIEPWINILLIDYSRPIYKDHLLPQGRLRDKTTQLHRAHYVIITKCPTDLSPLEKRIVRKSLSLYPYQKLFFTSMVNGKPQPMFDEGRSRTVSPKSNVIAMSGIGNPAAFTEGLMEKFEVVGKLEYPDHHPYRSRDLQDMMKAIESSPEDTVIITTEKDAVKLRGSSKIPVEIRERLFYIPVNIVFHDKTEIDFLKNIDNDVRTNPKHSLLHP